ncbi:MAG: insulinase family protein [Phycisphaerales bacterium]|nr:insulinase family protein [Phycisphaerales bacterium]
MIRRITLVAVVLSCSVSSAFADDRRYDFRQIQLDNGLNVITLEDFSCPIVAVQVWYHVGAKNEDPKRQGFAHMFEHMMFRGTDRLNETDHFDFIRRVGGDTNAYTAFDQTVYVQEVPSNQLEMVLWLEAERMGFLKIDEHGFRTERKVVEEELRMGHNRPYGRVPEKLLAEVFGEEPYGWTPGGQIEHLRNSTIEELQAFWDKYYVPNNATLVIVGDVKHEKAQSLAKKYFSWIPKCPAPPKTNVNPPVQKGSRTIKIEEDKGPLPVVGMMYLAVPESHPDFLPLEILMGVLGGGESSRLYVDVVKEQKIAQVALAAAFGLESGGIVGVGGVLLPFGKKAKLMKTIKEHINRIKKEPITQAELEKMKNQLRRNEVMGSMSVASKAGLLGQYAVLWGDAERINRRLDEIDAVTVTDVQRVAKKYLKKRNRIQVLVEPSVGGFLKGLIGGKKEDETEEAPLAEGDNRIAKRTGAKAAAKRPADFPSEPPMTAMLDEFPEVPYASKMLDNGLKVVVVSNHEVPMVTMRLGVKSGAWTEAKPGVASFAMSMLTKGTKTRNAKQLAEVLESNAISLTGSASMDSAAVSASALLPQLDLATELMSDVIQNPTFPGEELNILTQQTRMGLLVSVKTPEYLADRQLRRRLYGDHPYSRTTTGELEDIDGIKAEDLKGWWSEHLRPENSILYVAGDITPPDGFKLAEKHLAKWKVKGAYEPPTLAQLPEVADTHIYLVDRPGSVQSQIRVGHLSVTRRDSDYFVSRVLGNILGGGFNSRLNKAIRVEKGLTYGARGGFNARRFAGQFVISTFTKTPTTAETVQTILDEVDKIQSSPPTSKELGDTKTYITGKFPGDRETPEATVGDLWMIETQGLRSDYLRSYLQGIKSTTADAVMKAARKLIQKPRLTIVVVGEATAVQADLEKIAPVTVVPPNMEPTGSPGDVKKRDTDIHS